MTEPVPCGRPVKCARGEMRIGQGPVTEPVPHGRLVDLYKARKMPSNLTFDFEDYHFIVQHFSMQENFCTEQYELLW